MKDRVADPQHNIADSDSSFILRRIRISTIYFNAEPEPGPAPHLKLIHIWTRIRIGWLWMPFRIRQNDVDLTGSGFKALLQTLHSLFWASAPPLWASTGGPPWLHCGPLQALDSYFNVGPDSDSTFHYNADQVQKSWKMHNFLLIQIWWKSLKMYTKQEVMT